MFPLVTGVRKCRGVPSSSFKNRRARKGYELPLREGQAGVRQRRSKKRFHQPSLPRAALQTSRSMPERNPAFQAEALGRTKEPLPQKDPGCVSVCCLHSALGVVVWQELSLQLLQPHGIQGCKAPSPSQPCAKQSRSVCRRQLEKPGH